VSKTDRETELFALYPAKDVSNWLGNSVPVAMKHYAPRLNAGARKEVFEDAAIKPSGAMPEKADDKSEADAKQNAKQTVATASGPHEHVQKKSPRIAGSLPLPPPTVILGHNGVMGDTELESVTSTMSTWRSNQLS
jgi:hypothetical protein